MKIIYLIIAHKDFPQLERMVNALQGKEVSFYIHIDRDIRYTKIKQLPGLSSNNITFISNRFTINWGGFNMVRATLALMKAASKEEGEAYHVLLSGQDFPLRCNSDINNFLSENYGKQFLTYWDLPHDKWSYGGLNRFQQYWFIDDIGLEQSTIIADLQLQSGFQRNGIFSFPFFGGSQWWCFTECCVNYILRFIKSNPLIIEYFEKTLIADELFFHSIILNSPFKDSIINDNLRYIIFEENASHPNVFLKESFDELQSSGKLWARKFNQQKDAVILDLLEQSMASPPISKCLTLIDDEQPLIT